MTTTAIHDIVLTHKRRTMASQSPQQMALRFPRRLRLTAPRRRKLAKIGDTTRQQGAAADPGLSFTEHTDLVKTACGEATLPDLDTRSHECSPVEEDPESCHFCSRPPGVVLCRSCGHTFRGRARSACPSHATVIHLMDVEACTLCRSFKLREVAVKTWITSSQHHCTKRSPTNCHF